MKKSWILPTIVIFVILVSVIVFYQRAFSGSELPPATPVFGINADGNYKAYREIDLAEIGTIEDLVEGVNMKVEYLEEGKARVTNLDSNKERIAGSKYFFWWRFLHPNTELGIEFFQADTTVTGFSLKYP